MIKISNLKNKGFMLAEVIITSSVIAVTLATLYITLNKVSSLYETNARYNDIDAQQIAIETDKILKVANCMYGEKGLYTTNNVIYDATSQELDYSFGGICDENYVPQDALINEFPGSYAYFVPTSMIENLKMKDGFRDNPMSLEYVNYLTNTVDIEKYKYFIVIVLKKNPDDDNSYYYYTLKVGDEND